MNCRFLARLECYCFIVETDMYLNAAERVRQRIAEWVEHHGYGSQRQLARAVPAKFGEPRGDQWIHDVVKGKSDLRLKDLDPIAEAMGVPPGWLVRRPDRNYEELTMQESKLLRYFRALPEIVRHGFMTWMDYFFRAQDAAIHGTVAERQKQTATARKSESARARTQKMISLGLALWLFQIAPDPVSDALGANANPDQVGRLLDNGDDFALIVDTGPT